MSKVELDEQEWQQVMGILSTAPWRDANPLLMKIGSQLRLQQQHQAPATWPARTGDGRDTEEVDHG
jgi:hypothetical protein